MLQQTQVERVVPFYIRFIKEFPTARKLARAPLSAALKSWQGLGYNRRAKLLHKAATILADMPLSAAQRNLVERLESLPGVGPATARAIAAFAYNKDVIFVETNIRTAVIHHFFPWEEKISDAEIEKVLTQVIPNGRAREWYSALMDYGAHLKRSGISHNVRSTSYVAQSKFPGSLREARGAILRELMKGTSSRTRIVNLLGVSRRAQVVIALGALKNEGLICVRKNRVALGA
ncbi:MAG TPA: A/G-specific adenine glycosylase [Candidatus Paceibacterota bacterium]|nr:A/G-specific adenine glycosylase [Candidatus Paceibacterota bacterium]